MPNANAQPPSDGGQKPGRRSVGATRQALLAATATAIARTGWSAVTTRQVAALAHVNPALVHYHFGSMGELRRQAVLAAMAEEIEGPMSALLADVPLADAIAASVEAVAQIDPGSDRFALLYEALLEGARDPEVRAVLVQAYDQFRSALTRRIREAGGPEPEAAAVVVTAALDGVLLHRLVKPDVDVVGLTGTLVAAIQIPRARHEQRADRSRHGTDGNTEEPLPQVDADGKGKDHVRTHHKPPERSHRIRGCRRCGGHGLRGHPDAGPRTSG